MSLRQSFDVLKRGYSPERSRRDKTNSSDRLLVRSRQSSIAQTSDHAAREELSPGNQNNIAVLLQTPIQRTGLLHTATSGLKGPSRSEITPVTLSPIAHVDPSTFRGYISQVGPLFEAFRRAHEAKNEQDSHLVRDSGGQQNPNEFATDLSRRLREEQAGFNGDRQRKGTTISSNEQHAQHSGRTSLVGSEGPQLKAHPLNIVPSVYFDPKFQLENPRTFDVVSEHSDVIPSGSGSVHRKSTSNGSVARNDAYPRKTLLSNAILQEKMSWYLDTVEVHLISAISASSDSFFEALGSLKALHAEASDSVHRLRSLRENLKKLDNDVAVGGVEIVERRRRRETIRQLGETARQLKQVIKKVRLCETVLRDGDLEQGIDRLESLELYVLGEEEEDGADHDTRDSDVFPYRERLRDLSGLRCLQATAQNIDLLRIRIGKGFQSRFLGTLLEDLRRHARETPNTDTIRRWRRSYNKGRLERTGSSGRIQKYPIMDDDTKASLRSSLRGLARCRYTASAATAYRESIELEMKSLVRTHLPSSTDDDSISMASGSTQFSSRGTQLEKSAILARNLRALEPVATIEMLSKIFCGISEVLRKLSLQVKLLLDITSNTHTPAIKSPFSPSAAMRSPGMTPRMHESRMPPNSAASVQSDRTALAGVMLQEILDLSSLMGMAVIVAQRHIVRILKVRSEQTSRMGIDDFLTYFNLVRLFVDDCEALSGRDGTELKTIVNSEIGEYVKVMTVNQKQTLLRRLETEAWNERDFGPEADRTLNRILEASSMDADSWAVTLERGSAALIQETNGLPTLDGGTGTPSIPQSDADASKELDRELQPAVDAAMIVPPPDGLRKAGVDDQSFILPYSAISLLDAIEEYEHLISAIPGMAQEVSTGLLDYLLTFNSETYRLALKAKALEIESNTLKSITTRHLAISSQSLSFVMAMIPYIREFVRRHIPASARGFLADFDRVKLAYQEHQIEVHQKIIEIMMRRVVAHATAMRKIDWDEQDPNARPNEYMSLLCRDTLNLYKTIGKRLPEPVVDSMMTAMFQRYREQFVQGYKQVPLKTEKARQSMLRDVEAMQDKLGIFPACNALAVELKHVIETKTIGGSATDRK